MSIESTDMRKNYSSIIGLLKENKIPISLIAHSARVYPHTAARALDPTRAAGCRKGTVDSVRQAAVRHLRAANAKFDPESLWPDSGRGVSA